MVDAFSLLVSHGMLAYVIWRLLVQRDPDEGGNFRIRPGAKD
jgi:hypothetical protein